MPIKILYSQSYFAIFILFVIMIKMCQVDRGISNGVIAKSKARINLSEICKTMMSFHRSSQEIMIS